MSRKSLLSAPTHKRVNLFREWRQFVCWYMRCRSLDFECIYVVDCGFAFLPELACLLLLVDNVSLLPYFLGFTHTPFLPSLCSDTPSPLLVRTNCRRSSNSDNSTSSMYACMAYRHSLLVVLMRRHATQVKGRDIESPKPRRWDCDLLYFSVRIEQHTFNFIHVK